MKDEIRFANCLSNCYNSGMNDQAVILPATAETPGLYWLDAPDPAWPPGTHALLRTTQGDVIPLTVIAMHYEIPLRFCAEMRNVNEADTPVSITTTFTAPRIAHQDVAVRHLL